MSSDEPVCGLVELAGDQGEAPDEAPAVGVQTSAPAPKGRRGKKAAPAVVAAPPPAAEAPTGFDAVPPEMAAEGAVFSDESYRAMLESADVEPEPRPVPLKMRRAGGDEDPGPPQPVRAAAEPAPRFVHQNERAPKGAGLVRFVTRCTNYPDMPVRYVLAASEQQAREHYFRATGLAAALGRLQADGAPQVEAPRFLCRRLPD